MSKVPAIVSSAGNPAAVTIVQTLGPLGIPIHALSNVDHAACWYSRYTTERHRTPVGEGGQRAYDNIQEPEALLDYMLEKVQRGVLFPGSDANIRFLSGHKQRLLDAGFHLLIPDEDVLRIAANKSDVAMFCAENGFAVPRTVVVRSRADLDQVRDALKFPVVLKGVYLKNHRFVDTKDDLDRCYDEYMAKARRHPVDAEGVAQEWVAGGDDRFVKLYVVCDQDSRVVASHTLRRMRVHTRRDGSQGDTLAARTERVQAVIDHWVPFFTRIGWVGVASLECKYDPQDGSHKLIEINPRPWAILKISVDCGINVPLLYYRLAQHEAVEPQEAFEEGRYYIRLIWGNLDLPEPVAVAGMLLTGRIRPWEVVSLYWKILRSLPRLTIDVGRLRDPAPTLACIFHHGVRRFGNWF